MSNKLKSLDDYQALLEVLKENYDKSNAPSVTLISNIKKDPFHVLISTIISLRTKDEVTVKSSLRLFEKADDVFSLNKLSIDEIAELIYPCGFYKTKAVNLKVISERIINEFNGKIPDTMEKLLDFNGVGRKTANLVLILGFGKDGICVDTHVHRISNRIGWVKTKTPEETEFALLKTIPKEFWKLINEYLVSYGQTICKPISPFCSLCKLSEICKHAGVVKSR